MKQFTIEQLENAGFEVIFNSFGYPTFTALQLQLGFGRNEDYTQLRSFRVNSDRDIWAVCRHRNEVVRTFTSYPLLP